MYETFYASNDYRFYLAHHGIKGQKWGVRRFQNADGSSKTRKKGFWQKRKENFRNMLEYESLKDHASRKYNLRELDKNASNEQMRNEAERNSINREMRSIYGEKTYRQTSKDYNPYGTEHTDKYKSAKLNAERYVHDTFIKKYGNERLEQAKKSEIAYGGLAFVGMLSLSIALTHISNKLSK